MFCINYCLNQFTINFLSLMKLPMHFQFINFIHHVHYLPDIPLYCSSYLHCCTNYYSNCFFVICILTIVCLFSCSAFQPQYCDTTRCQCDLRVNCWRKDTIVLRQKLCWLLMTFLSGMSYVLNFIWNKFISHQVEGEKFKFPADEKVTYSTSQWKRKIVR